MKTKYILLILILSAITLFSPLVGKANAIAVTTVKAKLKGSYSVKQKEEILKILKNRFENFSRKDVNIKIENDSIIVKIFIEVEARNCEDLMTKRGELLILRPYSHEQTYPYFKQIDSLLNTPDFKIVKEEMYNASINKIVEEVYAKQAESVSIMSDYYVEEQDDDDSDNPFFNIKNPNISAYYDDDNPLFKIMEPNFDGKFGNAVIGLSHERDTAKINNLFRNPAIKKYLLPGIRFIWATTDNWHKQYKTLCAIENPTANTEYITNYMIESSKAVKSIHYNIESNIQFKKKYHALWKKLTGDNIGSQLLVIIDNEIIMYPYVNGEIEGGRVSISGGMRGDENRVLSAILNSGLLNADIKVVEVTHSYPPMYYLMKLFN